MRTINWRLVMAAAAMVAACAQVEPESVSDDPPADDWDPGADDSSNIAGSGSTDELGATLVAPVVDGPIGELTVMGGATSHSVPATNPFVVVAHDPLSTFAAVATTESYDVYRQYAEVRTLPKTTVLRVEEFVNAFAYNYAASGQGDEAPFSIHLEASAHPGARASQLVRVGIQGKVMPPDEKKPTNLVFLVDLSTTMDSKWALAKDLMHRAVDVLAPTDTIAIVPYGGSAETPFPATPVKDGIAIDAAIDGLTLGGEPGGQGSLSAAYAQAEAAFIPEGLNHVVMVTNGHYDVSDPVALEGLIIEEHKRGVTLTVALFDPRRFVDETVERLARAGNGVHGYIWDSDDARDFVENRMLQSLRYIAKDVKLEVEFNAERVYAYRLIGYELRDMSDLDSDSDVVEQRDIVSGHRVTALYEVALSESALPTVSSAPPLADGPAFSGEAEVAAGELVRVKVRYKLPGALETDPVLEVSSSLESTPIQESFSAASSDLQWAAAVATFAEILKGSPYASRTDLETLAAVFEAQATRDEGRAEFYELFQRVCGSSQ